MNDLSETFGCKVFNDAVMRERLPAEVYESIRSAVELGTPIPRADADVIAGAMKDWAVELGATHFTHWFQPMTNVTAEKHDSFISIRRDGTAIMEFSGKELVKGESDASSFPSGGLRATFEARGYTAWDPTSRAFVKDETLYIPCAFYSYSGVTLDKKTPLMRSIAALNTQALRVLKLFGNDARRVTPTVGAEQEYFLVDKKNYDRRRDLVFTGRTLFGAKPPRGQELGDHYYGAIKPRIREFMKDLDRELWELGIPAKTEHNEAAPAQHELALLYSDANIATDHNQLTMELLCSVAERHGLVCLLHEKPFRGVNGSGKHNNWSMATDSGLNLLEPGTSPEENAQFLIFLCAVIKAVDEYPELYRLSVATAGNDQRLGGYEAPPAVISVFLGDELTAILEAIEEGRTYHSEKAETMRIGVDVLPTFPKDTTDRNRTSPLAFTGNKLEFRMPGAPVSTAGPNIILNTTVAESLRCFADELSGAENFESALNDLIRDTIKRHKRIIFNGNSYSADWLREAETRGLVNLRTTADAVPLYLMDKNVELFERHGVFTRQEIESRCYIKLTEYCKKTNIEALTMIEMVRREIMPSVFRYMRDLSELAVRKSKIDLPAAPEKTLLTDLSGLAEKTEAAVSRLEELAPQIPEKSDPRERALFCKDEILPCMDELREAADALETLTGKTYWPYPTYGRLLFDI